ncbi:ABC transporter ATP-binding protein [Paraburkholderia sp. BL25I1N1]|uniref:ABC transporter ATP-binding protein n=1 Tax=Paraburkholderia sp. BL25I1N1 TaxID=1938804 RepID=UPI000D3FAB8A|nr:ABC transporter ATP-binding protein [Paraburkholderia sp. BL25I1N1]PRX96441.1 amino acid/amide ABC transporter ATP-binding protein 2 (HAAT family) [Paraburkholderia sp. BL25I1N1]
MSATNDMLNIKGVDSFYGASRALFGVSFDVHRGDSVALLGRNGAGKSTTLKSIMGLADVRNGIIQVSGHPARGCRPEHIARLGVAYVPEDRQVFRRQSVEANLTLGMKAGADGGCEWTLERVYSVFPMLWDARRKGAGTLSGGQQQMLVIARALLGNPLIMLLDEPSQGLSPLVMDQLQLLLQQLRQAGMTLVLAEQNMRFCMGVASRAVVINQGSVVFDDDIAAFNADEALRHRYLAA